MKPDEVVSLLSKIDIPVSVPTLARYVRDGLISEPERGGHGRGGGRWTEYSLFGVVEAATAWKLLNGKIEIPGEAKQTIRFSPSMVKLVREEALLECGRLINGTEGAKFINPSFLETDGVNNYASMLKGYFEELELLEAERAKGVIVLQDGEITQVPSWMTRPEFNTNIMTTIHLLRTLQSAYVFEYGDSILSLFFELECKI